MVGEWWVHGGCIRGHGAKDNFSNTTGAANISHFTPPASPHHFSFLTPTPPTPPTQQLLKNSYAPWAPFATPRVRPTLATALRALPAGTALKAKVHPRPSVPRATIAPVLWPIRLQCCPSTLEAMDLNRFVFQNHCCFRTIRCCSTMKLFIPRQAIRFNAR